MVIPNIFGWISGFGNNNPVGTTASTVATSPASSNTVSAAEMPSSTGSGDASARSLLEMERNGDVSEVSKTYGENSLAFQLEKEREFNSNQADIAYKRQLDYLENYYSRLMSGLKKAGLNPILASGSSFNGSHVPQASSSAVGGDTYADMINAGSNRRDSTSRRISAISSAVSSSASMIQSVSRLITRIAAVGVFG